jgi:hypothetical protein
VRDGRMGKTNRISFEEREIGSLKKKNSTRTKRKKSQQIGELGRQARDE